MPLGDKVRFLAQPQSYPRPTMSVTTRETHTSLVFLTDDRAYKLKKPVRFPYLDFTHLESRKKYCHEEIRLNQELAGKVYLRAVHLARAKDGTMSIGGRGRIIDWLVEMQRLPEDLLLDRCLAAGTATPQQMDGVVRVLHHFYQHQRQKKKLGYPYVEHLKRESLINASHLHAMRTYLGRAYSRKLIDACEKAIDQVSYEIQLRVATHMVVEGHGDLRPEHVCLLPEPVIIDRLEFDPDMLFIDMYDEVNYLGIECMLLGADWVRPLLLQALERRIGNAPTPELLAAYGVFRCLLRARLSIDHLRDKNPRTPGKWPRLAKGYLRIATGILKQSERQLSLAVQPGKPD